MQKKRRKRRAKQHRKILAVDTETTGLNVWRGHKPFMVTMAHEDGWTEAIEWDVDPLTREPQVDKHDLAFLQETMIDESIIKPFFNAKFDMNMLASIGVETKMRARDGARLVEEVSFMSRCCNNLNRNQRLKPLAKLYLDIEDDDESALHEAVKRCRQRTRTMGWALASEETHSDKPFHADYWIVRAVAKHCPEKMPDGVAEDACAVYGMRDAERTLGLYVAFSQWMSEDDLWGWYETEMELLPITMQLERKGVMIDKRRMKIARQKARKEMAAAMRRLECAYGEEFNPNAPTQVCRMLFGGKPLRLVPTELTPNKQPSTKAEVLINYVDEPLVRDLLTWKARSKAISTFFNSYEQLATDNSTVIHPGYRQAGTVTWRYSCADPNLQQVTSPETSNSRAAEFLVDVRQVFMPRPGYHWFAPDYDQLEVIIFAALYQVATMLAAIRNGQDIHSAVTERIWGGEGNAKAIDAAESSLRMAGKKMDARLALMQYHWSIEAVDAWLGLKTHRKLSKSATFTKIFGGGPNALRSWIGCTFEEAKQILRDYDRSFPDMMEAMAEEEHRGRVDGYVWTPYGQRLMVDRWASYKVINHKVQCTAAAVMKHAMIKGDAFLRREKADGEIVLTEHDELIFEMRPEDATEDLLRELCMIMADHEGRLCVPLSVSMDRMTERWSRKEKVAL